MFRLGRSTLEVKRKLGAYDCGSGGRWFESTQLYQAEITQETASHDSLFLALILRTAVFAPHPRRLAPLRNGLCGVVAVEKCVRIAARGAGVLAAMHAATAVGHCSVPTRVTGRAGIGAASRGSGASRVCLAWDRSSDFSPVVMQATSIPSDRHA